MASYILTLVLELVEVIRITIERTSSLVRLPSILFARWRLQRSTNRTTKVSNSGTEKSKPETSQERRLTSRLQLLKSPDIQVKVSDASVLQKSTY